MDDPEIANKVNSNPVSSNKCGSMANSYPKKYFAEKNIQPLDQDNLIATAAITGLVLMSANKMH